MGLGWSVSLILQKQGRNLQELIQPTILIIAYYTENMNEEGSKKLVLGFDNKGSIRSVQLSLIRS